jgi:hypothetical protein
MLYVFLNVCVFIAPKHECGVAVYDFSGMNIHCNLSLWLCVCDFMIQHSLKDTVCD